METAIVSHAIQDQKSVSVFDLRDNFNIGITLSAVYLLSFFGVLGLGFLINELTYRTRFDMGRRKIKLSKRIALVVASFGVKRLSATGLFVLFVHLFLWLSQHFLTNNIKTNKVVRRLPT